MIHIRNASIFALSIFCLSLPADLVLADTKPTTQDFNHGLLWSISKDSEHVGYIFGTLHTNDLRVTKVPQKIINLVNSADNFCMETFPGVRYFNPNSGFKSIVNDMMLDDGNLVDLVGKPMYQEIEARLLAIGLKKERIQRLKPWAVMHSLSAIYKKGDKKKKVDKEILDTMLYEIAVKKSAALYQLETLEELMAAYYAFPIDAQVALLGDKLKAVDQIQESANKMVNLYLKQDLKGMLNLATDFISTESYAKGYDKVYLKHVLNIRNVVMAHYMLAPLRKKNTFFAIGALHLYGEKGVLALMENSYGYRVTPAALKW